MNSLSFLGPIEGRKILYAVLNWGLGHATRSIPVIRSLANNNQIWIGSNGLSLELLKKEFPDLPTVELPPYNINYKKKSFLSSMITQTPKVMLAMSKELDLTEVLVEKHEIDLVISDHRLGCHSNLCESIIIAHHIQIQTQIGFFGLIGSKINKFFINQFDTCWIPDYENRQMCLGGDLSDSRGLKSSKYIGPLSRFKKSSSDITYDICVVLSGPEPARTRLEKKLFEILSDLDLKVFFVAGSGSITLSEHPLIDFSSLSDSATLNKAINSSRLVISRSGYSTVMDLVNLGKRAILIPTPGQTEQEYIARHLANREEFHFVNEDELNESTFKDYWNSVVSQLS